MARFAVHSREHLALIRPANNVLTLCTLYYPEEIREVKETPQKPDAKHLEMAMSLIDQQTIEFNPENCKDRYKEALMEMLSKKQPEVVKQEVTGEVTDLMEVLKKSLEAAKSKQKSA